MHCIRHTTHEFALNGPARQPLPMARRLLSSIASCRFLLEFCLDLLRFTTESYPEVERVREWSMVLDRLGWYSRLDASDRTQAAVNAMRRGYI